MENYPVEVKILGSDDNESLQKKINDFLMDLKINKDELIDIKMCRSEDYKTAMIIYSLLDGSLEKNGRKEVKAAALK